MRKYYKQVITWSAIVLVAITLIFCFLPSAVKQGLRLRLNMYFTVASDFPVKMVFIKNTIELEERSAERGVLVGIDYRANKVHVNICDYPEEQIDFLRNYEISSLGINSSKVKDISSMSVDKLKEVWIIDTPVKEISVVSGFDSLEFLCLAYTKVNDLAPIRKLKKLKKLFFHRSEGKSIDLDVSFLKELVNLEAFGIRNVKINDSLPLCNLTNISSLYLLGCEIQDFSFLKDLKQLNHINLARSNIIDLNSLANQKNLERLYLNNTNVKDLSPLKNLKKLKYLDIQSTPATKLPLPEWTKSIRVEK